MNSLETESVNTKLEAYKLIHDPTRLFNLLYSKYGDIEDDYFISFINQLIFNVPTKYNRIYKESLYTNNIQEFMRRYYRKYEAKDRIPKLSDYYKNYLRFFCRPFFKQLILGKIVHNFQDKQAEIFYKNNYNDTLDYEKEKEKNQKDNSDKKSSDELSSLDNITNNKIIFDERTKKIIDNDLKNEFCTLTLESPRINDLNINNNKANINISILEGELISKRSNANNSFEKVVHYLVHSQFKKKMENKKKKRQIVSKKKLINSPSAHPPYLAKILKNNYYSINSVNREIIPKAKKIKNSLYTLARHNIIKSAGFQNYNINKGFLSPKIFKNNFNMNVNSVKNSKIENIKNSKPNSHIHSFQNFSKNNKINYSTNNNFNNKNKISKVKNTTRFNTNSIYKNFSNLSESLNKYKQISNKNSNMTTFTNKNNFNLSKSKRVNFANSSNLLTKSNNKIDNIKMKSNNINIPKSSNLNLNIKMNKLPYHHFKNKTFDFNSLQPNEHLTKFNTNNNLHNFRAFYNKKVQVKNKINSKFNLMKKPITEVASQIGSPSNKKIDNKINKDKSISHNKDKTKKIFFGLYQYNKSNIINNHKFDSPKIFSVSRKNMTYSSDENNRDENLNLEKIAKRSINYKTNRKQSLNNANNYVKSKENIYNWKIKTSFPSPLANYNSNYNKLVKNKIYGSFNNTMKIDNHSLQKKEEIKSKTKYKNSKIKENKNNIFNNSNRINNDFLEMVNDNLIFSRNKKQNTSKISSTKSQNEVNIRDICIKSIKNLKSSAMGSKKNMINRTYLNKNKKNNINHNFKPINSSSEIKNVQTNNVLSKLNLKKIAFKKKTKKFSQRVSINNVKKNIYRKPKGNSNNNKINVIFNGDVIINKNQVIEIKQNSINSMNKSTNKDNNKNTNAILPINCINKERGNSVKIINVNRNINLINKKEQNNNA